MTIGALRSGSSHRLFSGARLVVSGWFHHLTPDLPEIRFGTPKRNLSRSNADRVLAEYAGRQV